VALAIPRPKALCEEPALDDCVELDEAVELGDPDEAEMVVLAIGTEVGTCPAAGVEPAIPRPKALCEPALSLLPAPVELDDAAEEDAVGTEVGTWPAAGVEPAIPRPKALCEPGLAGRPVVAGLFCEPAVAFASADSVAPCFLAAALCAAPLTPWLVTAEVAVLPPKAAWLLAVVGKLNGVTALTTLATAPWTGAGRAPAAPAAVMPTAARATAPMVLAANPRAPSLAKIAANIEDSDIRGLLFNKGFA
jgi:hypothetical protein